MEYMALFLFISVCFLLMFGYPVAFTLAGTSLIFAAIGITQGIFASGFIEAFPDRVFGIMNNGTLIAVPFFILMGVLLEKSRIAEKLLANMAQLLGRIPGGLGVSVVLVGILLAASTGIVGATVVTMGLITLPVMMKHRYDPALSTGIICATGTLGQIIPPSIALVLLGDILSTAYHQAQLSMGVFNPKSISVGDLFVGALLPGLILASLYIAYIMLQALFNKKAVPAIQNNEPLPLLELCKGLFPPLVLIGLVLGSILTGVATPTEAAAVGALGATLLAFTLAKITLTTLHEALVSTLKITCMVFMILIGAALFSLVFRGFGGDELVQSFFTQLPGGKWTAVFVVMLFIFLLGFILDFIEITFVVVPIVSPILMMMGVDPLWLGIMIAVNLQTSFLTPPFGFALFYLRGVAPASISTATIYKGVMPFIFIQLLLLLGLCIFPELVTWLPQLLMNN
jgi:tripartite ATP-independent transporter DctM subunit